MSPQPTTHLAPVALSPMALPISKMLPALLVTIAIAGCGGGGDAPSSAVVAPAPPPSATVPVAPPTTGPVLPTSSSIVTSVPTPTYAPGSRELAAYTFLNEARANCGFGKLVQNVALDAAARNHGNWLLLTNNYSHTEIAGTPGFTGIDATARAVAAGYNGYSVEALTNYDGTDPTRIIPITNATSGFLGIPYHALGLLRGNRDVGVGAVDQIAVAQTGWYQGYLLFEQGLLGTERDQTPIAGTVRTYPCDGAMGVIASTPGEFPEPLPGRSSVTNPWGPSIVIMGDQGTTLVLSSARLVNVSTGAAVTLQVPVTKPSDPNPRYLQSNEGYVLVDMPLAKGTRYQASISGTSNGAAFSRTFTFTTGAN